jgi:hypothetical protein
MDAHAASITELPPLRYSITVEGRLDGSWAGWFNCESLRSEGETTVLEVAVSDQAQLHAVMRRVHDLHLRLVSVTRLGSETISSEGGLP